MASNSNNKRRRTAADTLHISDLPIGFIVDIAAYLPKPSRAILSVAFSAPSSSSWNDYDLHRQSPISTAIISAEQWDILDFEDVDDLASKLTDDDIYAILTCINAHDMLKRLKLRGCINITGIGLNPLRGSVVLEQIDLSLVGKYECPYPAPKSKISDEVVAPILVSIVSSDDCSLKCVQLNTNWKREWEHPYPLRDFLRRYNEMFSTRNMVCSKCNVNIQGIGEWMFCNRNRKICYDCLAPLCSDCSLDNLNGGFCLQGCVTCDKAYCTDCVTSTRCPSCRGKKCKGCGDMKACDECQDASCEDCLNTCGGCNRTRCDNCVSYRHCEGTNCSKSHCADCYNGKEYSIKYCEECDSEYCLECKVKEAKRFGVDDGCRTCAVDIVPVILEENTSLSKENEQLRAKLYTISQISSVGG